MTQPTPNNDDDHDLQRLQDECVTMVKLIKQLEEEERMLQNENTILAREAILCGYNPALLEPVIKTKRKVVQRKIKGEPRVLVKEE